MSEQTILLADDDRAIRTVINQALARVGFRVRATSAAATLWKWVCEGEGDLVITDVIMPDENGLDLLPRIKKIRPDLPIVVMSAHSTLLTAVQANARGAYEYLPKPFDLDDLTLVVKRALANDESAAPPGEADAGSGEPAPLVGRSPAMQEVYRQIARLAATELTVLISGESGTGKELIARALHEYGGRAAGPFVAINMAAIPRELIESELFGHERGAFTGATRRTIGRFRQADGGTLFLDEIGDMPLEAQTRLLRVLQDGEYTSIGGRAHLRADARIIAATNHDLGRLVHQGMFREDLFYRLSVVPLRVPPLRERSEDVPDLVSHFVARAQAEGLAAKSFDGAAIERLQAYRWPGNVRELENLVRRFAALYAEAEIGGEAVARELDATAGPAQPETSDDNLGAAVERHLDRYFAAHGGGIPPEGLYARILHEVERPLISLSLRATGGNQVRTARLLGINRNTLRKKMRELAIPVVRHLK